MTTIETAADRETHQATENCRATWMCDVVVTRTDNRFEAREARPTPSPENGVIFIAPIAGGHAISCTGDLDVLLATAP